MGISDPGRHVRQVPLFILVARTVLLHVAAITPPNDRPGFAQPLAGFFGACTRQELRAKDIDIALFGSTGFMGRRFAHYIVNNIKEPVRWAFVGRNHTKMIMQLRGLRQYASAEGSEVPAMLVADLSDSVSVVKVARRAKIIINLVGPYEQRNSEALIPQALRSCAHYIDIAAEAAWRGKMMRRYGALAKERGVVMVQSAGFSSLLSDFLALHAANRMAADGQGPPDTVYLKVMKMNGIPTGSGFASGAADANGTKNPYQFAPLAKLWQRVDKKLEGQADYGYSNSLGEDAYYWPPARSDPLIIRRTMLEAFPDKTISVREVCTQNFFRALKKFLENHVKTNSIPRTIPAGGQGPPSWIIEDGSWEMEAVALRSNPKKRSRVVISAPRDPVVSGTVRLCTQLALTLLHRGPFEGKAGYRTPATAVDQGALEKRLRHVDDGKWLTIVHGYSPEQIQNMTVSWVGLDGSEELADEEEQEEVEEVPEEEKHLVKLMQARRINDTVGSGTNPDASAGGLDAGTVLAEQLDIVMRERFREQSRRASATPSPEQLEQLEQQPPAGEVGYGYPDNFDGSSGGAPAATGLEAFQQFPAAEQGGGYPAIFAEPPGGTLATEGPEAFQQFEPAPAAGPGVGYPAMLGEPHGGAPATEGPEAFQQFEPPPAAGPGVGYPAMFAEPPRGGG